MTMDGLPPPSRRWALFLDLDGTLIDLAPQPDLVVVPPAVVADLRRIEQALGGALAIVSGRALDQLDPLLAPWRPVAAGEHGAFCRLPAGEGRRSAGGGPVIFFVPLHETRNAHVDRDRGLEAQIAFAGGDVGVGLGHVAGLHRLQV